MISRNSINGAFPIKRLGEVVEFLDSKRRPVTESDRRAGPYPYYGANGIQGTIDEFIFDEPLVLLAEDGGHFGEPDRGIAYRISGKTWVNNHAHVLRPTSAIELAYLCRVLENYDVTPFVTGTTRGKLTKAGASEIVIPLPPLAEQRRIAEVLDRAEALRAKRRAALAQLDSLTQSLFLDLFGDPATNPKKLPRVALSEVTTRITDGTHLTPKFVDSGVPFIFVKNVRNGSIDFQTDKFISEEEHAALYKRCPVEEGDVLYTTVGATYGQAASVGSFTKFAFQRHLAHLKPDPKKIVPSFLGTTMQLPLMKRQADRWARGVAQPTINLKELREMVVPLPPISLQREFARRVTAVEALKTAQRTSLAELDALFASLQHRAFRGEL